MKKSRFGEMSHALPNRPVAEVPRPVGDHDHAAIATVDGALSPRYQHRQPLQMVL